ncbi:MAG: thioredoxin family protein [Clostridia bacterium]|nr:thioredoxin family protein [Clostridia bacterium]
MKIIALGGCCSKSQQNFENAKIAAKNCGISEAVEQEKDFEKIMAYGVMATPALVIDNNVVSMGRMLTVEQIEKIIKMKQ